MKKIGLYSLLVAGLLFTAGCANKEVAANNTANSSEENSNASQNSTSNVAEGALIERGNGGNYYNIDGERTFIEHVYFDFDKYTLSGANKEKAVSNASKLAKVKSNTIVVYGNADERGSDEYNYALGLKRANSVKNILVNNGVEANITIKSLGESNPACTEATESCYSKNRRVEQELTK